MTRDQREWGWAGLGDGGHSNKELSAAPGSRLVRQTSNSAVAGLPTATAPAPSSARRRCPKFSAREHSAQVSTCIPRRACVGVTGHYSSACQRALRVVPEGFRTSEDRAHVKTCA